MNYYDKYTTKELKLLNIQMIASFIFIITILISIYLTNKEKQNIINNTNKNYQNIEIINRIIIFVLVLVYLYINLYNTKIAKERNQNTFSFELQDIASL